MLLDATSHICFEFIHVFIQRCGLFRQFIQMIIFIFGLVLQINKSSFEFVRFLAYDGERIGFTFNPSDITGYEIGIEDTNVLTGLEIALIHIHTI